MDFHYEFLFTERTISAAIAKLISAFNTVDGLVLGIQRKIDSLIDNELKQLSVQKILVKE